MVSVSIKPGEKVDETIELKPGAMKSPKIHVSRGILKIRKYFAGFLEISVEKSGYVGHWGINGWVCMDVMLQNGARKVYAVDVGTNQLAWKLRQDERVISRSSLFSFVGAKVADFEETPIACEVH